MGDADAGGGYDGKPCPRITVRHADVRNKLHCHILRDINCRLLKRLATRRPTSGNLTLHWSLFQQRVGDTESQLH